MTREELGQIRHLHNEIKLLQEELEKCIKRQDMTTDSVTGSRLTIPYDKHTITIAGYNESEIEWHRKTLSRKIKRLQRELERLNEYIDAIEDSEIRQILHLRYRLNLSWQQVAFAINHYDEQYPRKKHNKYLCIDEKDEKKQVT